MELNVSQRKQKSEDIAQREQVNKRTVGCIESIKPPHRLHHRQYFLGNSFFSHALFPTANSVSVCALSLSGNCFFRMPPFQFRGNSNNRGSNPNPKHEFSFRYRPPPTADRPLLSRKRETTPEQLHDETQTKAPLKFASLSALSDSEEVEMDMSDDESDTEQRPRKKRAMGLDGHQDLALSPPPAPPTTKWSNPDPYTALPPPSEQTNKRVDVVKLIRKARIDYAAKAAPADAVKENSDFISLGAMPDPEPQNNAPENAPKGPRGYETTDSAIGSRKRTREDELKGFSRKTGKPASKYNYDGSVISEWKPLSEETATPWFEPTIASMHIGTQ